MLTGEDSPIRQATLEVQRHISLSGWDQPPRMFALVSTQQLLKAQPELASQLGHADSYTAIEQEGLPLHQELEELLTEIEWPESVEGCAVSVERIMLPPETIAELPEDESQLAAIAAEHPDRREVRIVTAVLRDGSTHTTVEARDQSNAMLSEGPELVPGLVELLLATFA